MRNWLSSARAVGNDRFAGVQGITGRRLEVGPDRRAANNTRVPTYPRAHEKSILARQIFEDLAEANFEPKGTKSRGFGKQRIEVGVRKSPASDFG